MGEMRGREVVPDKIDGGDKKIGAEDHPKTTERHLVTVATIQTSTHSNPNALGTRLFSKS